MHVRRTRTIFLRASAGGLEGEEGGPTRFFRSDGLARPGAPNHCCDSIHGRIGCRGPLGRKIVGERGVLIGLVCGQLGMLHALESECGC